MVSLNLLAYDKFSISGLLGMAHAGIGANYDLHDYVSLTGAGGVNYTTGDLAWGVGVTLKYGF